MSAAVYYNNPNMPVEYVHSKHTLPSLSQLVPIGQQQQGQSYNSYEHPVSPSMMPSNMVPLSSNGQMYSENKLQQQQSTQSTPDLYSNNSQVSSTNTTPTSAIAQNPAWGQGLTPEKCTCKSNQNRIPRPRNAFILFRQKYHQSVLDEGSVIRTNPEVSRELGRRWRALSKEEKEHWNTLAEEEKQNHAKKYPGYRYTPRRNGKSKNCPACHQKYIRQQQAQLHNQQMIQMQQDQYQQYLQLQQQSQQQTQQSQSQLQSQVQQPQPQPQPQAMQQAGSMQQNVNYINQPVATQYLVSNPYQQVQQGHPHSYLFSYGSGNEISNQHSQDKLSPLSVSTQYPVSQYPASHSSEYSQQVSLLFPMNYDTQNQIPMGQPQRFNSLPTPSTSGSYGLDSVGVNQQ